MRIRLLTAALTVAVAIGLTACGQIGQHQSPTPGQGTPIITSPTSPGVLPTPTLPPTDKCYGVEQLVAVDAQVRALIEQIKNLEGDADVPTVVEQLQAGFTAAQAAMSTVPTDIVDPQAYQARGLLDQVIAGYLSGLADLSTGLENEDEDLLVEAAVKLDAANKMLDDQYGPTIAKSACT